MSDRTDERPGAESDAGEWAGGLNTLVGNANPDPEGVVAAHPFGLDAGIAAYAEGVLVPTPEQFRAQGNAYPASAHPAALPAVVEGWIPDGMLRPFEVPHEATHRRFEPPRTALVNQAAAGYTLIAPPNMGLHYVKVLACFITLDAAGTLTFVQGGLQSASDAPMTGAMNLGGAATPALLLPPSSTENPWLFTAPDQALGIVTATGKAQGWVIFAYSPFDS